MESCQSTETLVNSEVITSHSLLLQISGSVLLCCITAATVCCVKRTNSVLKHIEKKREGEDGPFVYSSGYLLLLDCHCCYGYTYCVCSGEEDEYGEMDYKVNLTLKYNSGFYATDINHIVA